MIILLCFMALILSSHSAIPTIISMPICPESFSCPGLVPFKYPFYNVPDTRCGLIKVNCTSKGGEVQFGGRCGMRLLGQILILIIILVIYPSITEHLKIL
ncbi:hypothetical protein HanPSC8_Chr15g0661001 [Helianthus annuus]|nr:hypothetical protein HanPSC8_Chr15g0661001 [Helianthus annuus]